VPSVSTVFRRFQPITSIENPASEEKEIGETSRFVPDDRLCKSCSTFVYMWLRRVLFDQFRFEGVNIANIERQY
ncbi:MAG: hypothetical protein PHQ75_02025, partial [Thermoguttaceae bacterium]|nr:hypothetical protein [Thermoguttaceae bacterium]